MDTAEARNAPQTDRSILTEKVHEHIHEIREADILIGIPSYNNSGTIGHVVSAIDAGLTKYFPDKKAVLVNSDGGSTDDTRSIVENTFADHESILLSHRVEPFHKIVTAYQGIPGKGSAFRTIFEIARALNVKACAVVDSDLRSITPEWIDLLIRPVLYAGYDYVSPYYHRHKYDGTITNSIVYPLTRALYGKAIRQPIGGDFGFSGNMASFYLTKDVWDSDVARFGIDIWMTTTALANGFRVCQSFLGAKIHDAKDPGADLSSMLHQVVSSIFSLMEEYVEVWKEVHGSEPVRTYGFEYAVGLEPVNVNLGGMIEKFRLGVTELFGFYESFLSRDIMSVLQRVSAEPVEKFNLPDDIWAGIVYSYALAYQRRLKNTEHLLKSLTPLYLGKVASFVRETENSSAEEVNRRFEKICIAYESVKKDFIERWLEKGDGPGNNKTDVSEEVRQ